MNSPAHAAAAARQGDPAFDTFEFRHGAEVPSLGLRAEAYRHRATGAEHYHLACDNPENVFLVGLRTVPTDSSGVAHVLEHTALCGSRKYPVRDPFFMMLRRSLNTFMNAFTASDWTAYPFATKNRKDFDNLLRVYLDAVFFPRLDRLDFAQEGHRLEFAEPADEDSELLYKGVVFNEMKGAMSSATAVLWQELSRHLHPATTYRHNSGGDPARIPELTYDQLRAFHRRHYHPGNAIFMTFGDRPARDHQERFEQLALAEFTAPEGRIAVADETRLTAPLRVTEAYAVPADDGDATPRPRAHVVMGWLLGRGAELRECLRAQLLEAVLLDNSSSPLLHALESSPLGQSPSPLCGLEDGHRQMVFAAGLAACQDDSAVAVEALVLETLERVAAHGVAQEQVEAMLHQLELSQREISGGTYPHGLQLMLQCLPAAIHRGDPIAMLNIDGALDELRKDIADPGFIPGLVREWLLDNPHRVTLTLRPDPGLDERRARAESAQLAAIKERLSAADKADIKRVAAALAARQAQVDDPEILPKVTLEDVDREVSEPRRKDIQVSGSPFAAPVAFYGQATNGLAYQQIVLPLPALEEELLAVLPLYTACVTEFGCGSLDYRAVGAWQARVSGGIGCGSLLRAHADDEQRVTAYLSFAGKCLIDRLGELSELLRTTMTAARFDEIPRCRELVDQMATRAENSVTGRGSALAAGLAASGASPLARLTYRASGVDGIAMLKRLRTECAADGKAGDVLRAMATLHQRVTAQAPRVMVAAEPAHGQRAVAALAAAWAAAPEEPNAAAAPSAEPFSPPPLRERVRAARTTATAVNFCAKSYPTVPAGHPDHATLHVLAEFLRNGFLHRAIREQGGAYGAGARQHGGTATFRFHSYRDPRLTETIRDFDRAGEWLAAGDYGNTSVEEAVLGVIAAIDKPDSPAREARQAFADHLFGRSLEQKRELRERVLATTAADLRRVAAHYLQPPAASLGVIASAEAAATLGDAVDDIQAI